MCQLVHVNCSQKLRYLNLNLSTAVLSVYIRRTCSIFLPQPVADLKIDIKNKELRGLDGLGRAELRVKLLYSYSIGCTCVGTASYIKDCKG